MRTIPSAPLLGESEVVLPNGPAYADRPYEKGLTEKGRRFISVDLDASLVEELDRCRGKQRRGLYLDKVLSRALQAAPGISTAMS